MTFQMKSTGTQNLDNQLSPGDDEGMTRQEIEQAVTSNLGLIRGVIRKTLKKYGAKVCEADVEDIESNTVLCLLDGRLDNYRHSTEKKLQQWIGYIAMQRCVDYLRAIKKTISFAQEPTEDERPSKAMIQMQGLTHPSPGPEEAILADEEQTLRRARLQSAIEKLSDGDRIALIAMSDDSYTVRDYAQAEGIKEGNVHTRRHRLVKNIRKWI